MNAVEIENCHYVCKEQDLVSNSGVCVLVDQQQIALFYLPTTEKKIYAISNWDPIGKANVLSRGIVGSVKDNLVVASPLYKQHFDLNDGQCLEDEAISVKTYPMFIQNDKVFIEV